MLPYIWNQYGSYFVVLLLCEEIMRNKILEDNSHTYSSGLRFAKIVHYLYTEKHSISLKKLSEILDVHYKVVERYIRFMREDLISNGKCIFEEFKDVGERKIRLRQDPFTTSANSYQMASIYMGLKLLSFLKDTQIPEGLEDVSDRIKSTLKFREREFLKEYDKKFYAVNIGEKDYTQKEDLISDIMLSLIHEKIVKFDYFEKKHKVRPYTLMTFRAGLYLIGYTSLYKEIRMFALDRITNFKKLEDNFKYPQNYSPSELFKSTFGITQGNTENIILSFTKDNSIYVKERKWHETARIEEKNNTLLLKMECPITPELKQWILSCGSSVKVIAPNKLKEEIIQEVRNILISYKKKDK